jgi:hypothetical protein
MGLSVVWEAARELEHRLTVLSINTSHGTLRKDLPRRNIVKRDGKLTGDHARHALELMHATRRQLRP